MGQDSETGQGAATGQTGARQTGARQAGDIAHIVVADDDPAMRATLRDCLESGGYRVTEAALRADLMALLARGVVDLVILERQLQGEDGLALTRQIREADDLPVVMISGDDAPLSRVAGLEAGADDYIAKPFHLRELLARIGGILRRTGRTGGTRAALPSGGGTAAGRVLFDGWCLDCQRQSLVSPEARSCTLTASEFALLLAFLRNPGRVLSRDEIMDLVQGPGWVANDRVIDNQVRRLRRRIATADPDAQLIRSVRGAGYVLSATVRGAPCPGAPERVAPPRG